uniref:Uncharacterized protein n=1 Tax=Arundo donax TaxID=35708 RepID=A0A0A8XU02_ARUDO
MLSRLQNCWGSESPNLCSKCKHNIREYFRTRANLLLHFWFVLFLLEALGILSPELDFFAASDCRDSSSFFRALEKTG